MPILNENCLEMLSNTVEEQKHTLRHYTPYPIYAVSAWWCGETELPRRITRGQQNAGVW